MLTCDQCRAALLDRQYGLLDAAETAAAEAHLAACAACQAEQARVERLGRLLSAAARTDFPDVRFVAPAVDAPAPVGYRTKGRRQRSYWSIAGWAVAAALLLALGIPTGAHLATASRQETELAAATRKKDDLERQRRDAYAKRVEELTAAETAARNAEGRAGAAVSNLLGKLGEAQRELQAKQFSFAISGPASPQAGAPNEFHVQTRDLAGKPTAAKLTCTIKDQTNKIVSETTGVAPLGDYVLKLSPDLPLKPNSNLSLDVVASRTDGTKAELHEQLKLAAPVYATHLTTDKPLYQPGAVVHFRSLTLDRATLKPADEPLDLVFVVRDALGAETAIVAGGNQLALADGTTVAGPDGKPVRGIGAGDWPIPATAKGGEYTLAVKEANGRFPEERRKFLVNQYQAAKLNKELEWAKKSFGPGDEVVANCKVTNAAGPVGRQPVTAQAYVDGQPVPVPACGPTSADGTVVVRFKLPKQIEKGEGSLTVRFTDGGNRDSLVKPIPIALKKLTVDFYPEGGDLVAGVPNRVYFQCRTTLDKPADLKGAIVDDNGRQVAAVETLTDAAEPGINQGMGRFEFTPKPGRSYLLRIDQPAGTEGLHQLPAVKSDGVVLTAISEVSGGQEPIRVRIASPKVGRTLLVGAYVRGRLLDHRRVTVAADQTADVELKPEAGIGGVTRVTVFEEVPGPIDGVANPANNKVLVPLAERLIYRKPAALLKLTAEPDKTRYVPGERVTLSIKAKNEKDEPVAAIAVVGVVNKSVVTMADEKTFRSMPTHFLLTSEVRRPEDLEHADVLLGSHPKAAAALDLLLGTQGWRRFAEQKAAPPANPADDGDRVALWTAHSPRIEKTSTALALGKVRETYGPAATEARSEWIAAAQRLSRLRADQEFAENHRRLSAEVAQARAEAESARTKLAATLETRQRILRQALPGVCGVLLALALVGLVTGLWRGMRYYVSAAGALGLAAAAAVALAVTMDGAGVPGMQTAAIDQFKDGVQVAGENAFDKEHLGKQLDENGRQLGVFFGGVGGGHENDAGLLKDDVRINARGAVNAPADAAAPPAPMAIPQMAIRAAAPRPQQAAAKAEGQDKASGEMDDQKKLAFQEKAMGGRGENKKLGEAKRRMRELPAGGPGAGAQPNALGGGQLGPDFDLEFAPGLAADRNAANRRLRGFAFARNPEQQPPPPPFVVREYAHQHISATPGERTDFAETVFWHPVLILPKAGAKVSFDLSDEVTRYQVLVAAHTLDGRLGAVEGAIEARKPFSLESKLPVEITAGDRIDVPVTLANDTEASRAVAVTAESKGLTLVRGKLDDRLTLEPRQSARRVFSFQPSIAEGTAELRLSGRSDGFGEDAVVRTIPVVAEGFPVVGTVSDVIDGIARHEVLLPQTWVKGTLKCQVSVYPSTLAELQKGLEGLLREPGGCFEQTSTTNYPNALILQYLRESDQANPTAMKKAKGLLERGYAKLTSFEVAASGVASAPRVRQGFEWFGQFPAHEALTAYGLMQFRDMARVTDVDPKLLQRTRDYLLTRRDGKGGFTRNPQALDTFGRAPNDVTNAYIIWALTESGREDDITKELNLLAEQAKHSDDPYFLALVANSLLNRDRNAEAIAILRTLAGKLTKDGFLDGAKTSITGSGGRTLEIETTALAVLGWLKTDRPADFASVVRAAVTWIGKQRGGYGGFGSTQSTILALKALIAYTKANKKTPEAGELALGVGDHVISKTAFAAGTQDAMTVAIPDADRQLKPGKNDIRVQMTGKNNFPYTLTWSYQTLQPPSAEGCAVRLTATLDRPTLAEGETAHLNVKLENVSGKGQGMAVAIIGLPAGLKLPDDFAQLKDLARPQDNGKKPGRIGAFEVRGRELILYWRDLAPDAKVDLNIDLRAFVPGVYHGPASRAYLYYNPDVKHWTEPLAATIEAKE